jgi:hypothetical protein
MLHGPVLPSRFGTLFSGWDRLQEAVEARMGVIREFLDTVAASQEWSVKMIQRDDPPEAVPIRTSGADYLRRRKDTYEAPAQRAPLLQEACLAVDATLERVCRASVPMRAQGRLGGDGDVVFNRACLVAQDRIVEFHEAVADAERRLVPAHLSLDVSGPFPPYSFCPDMRDGA